MMNIDLKWLLPILMPFVMLFTFRALVWCAGMEWTEKIAGMYLLFSCILGFGLGCVIALVMKEDETRLTLRGAVDENVKECSAYYQSLEEKTE